ncbi:MAG: DPP IV N-terminal domain-containing protein [Fimbriimonas ginsengisoli]|uniref:DPP IV N-terminal domain-containing protein n=1 Tax=Fimbriimonas ginsengisoli TaxID=1005039 RepID=A0A931LS13_FIMGI|nr:DPP IV N-terminal domain-containing protein [Fimbriimonas ginsengisoli]
MAPRAAWLTFVAFLPALACAQDRLPGMPRYDRYDNLRKALPGLVSGGKLTVNWAADGRSFTFEQGGKTWTYDVDRRAKVETGTAPTAPAKPTPPGRRRPERGRQYDTVSSADRKLTAQYKDRNIWLKGPGDKEPRQITTEGDAAKRTKVGSASWVYGEELGQREAMWFSPDATKLAYYRFDESKVIDYYVTLNETGVQNQLDTEAYPKAGAPNPSVDLLVMDLATGKATPIDVRFRSDGDKDLGHYVWNVAWANDGKALNFFRMNRKQNEMELVSADPATGECHAVIRESNPGGWVADFDSRVADPDAGTPWPGAKPGDPNRFFWISERDGYRNLYLADTGGRLNPITHNAFDFESLVRVDKTRGMAWYTADDGDIPYKQQLHRIRLDGTDDKRLTDLSLSHTVSLAPGGGAFVDVAEALDVPPSTRLCDGEGHVIDSLAESDMSKFRSMGLRKAERLIFKAADGTTDLYGYLLKPSDFDPTKKYPLLLSIYAGPTSGTRPEAFQLPSDETELGFLVTWLDGRGTNGRGRAFRQAVYRKLGVVEMDDQAAGVRALVKRPYVDASRVGIHGTSYGGYASLMAILRFPDLFSAACASSPVTDWRHYDTIYTERFMDLPQDNKAGYDAGSAITYANNLKGKLLIYYGTADNNVHPSNTLQFIKLLQSQSKGFEVAVGPDLGHSPVDRRKMMEFFMDNLMLKPKTP